MRFYSKLLAIALLASSAMTQQTTLRHEQTARIHTRDEAEARQLEVRGRITALVESLPEKTLLNPSTILTFQAVGYRMEKVIFYSQPNFLVTAILYLPDRPGKLPAIVMTPAAGGKAADYVLASVLARNGFIVLTYDPIGQGERSEAEPADASPPAGDAFIRYTLWDAIRAVDYLQTRYEVDPKRIGAFGRSGTTVMLGALDARVQAIALAGDTAGFVSYGLDLADWIELAAPRPYAVISASPDTVPLAEETRRFYSLFDPAAFEWITGGDSLLSLQSQIVSFFLKHLAHSSGSPRVMLTPDGASPKTPNYFPKDIFQVTPTGQVATSYPDAETVYTLIRKENQRHRPHPPEQR